MVPLTEKVIGVVGIGDDPVPLICAHIGDWDEVVEDVHRGWVKNGGRNDVACKRRPVNDRIFNRRVSAEIASPLRKSRHDRATLKRAIQLAQSLIRKEEKVLVLADRAADRSAVLVPVNGRLES